MLNVCHIARDIRASGGGEVVKQVARHQALRGARVVVITDTAEIDLGANVTILLTPLGNRLLTWVPKSRVGWMLRHAAQIFTFTILSSALALPLRLRGFTVFNHNCESLVGQILVMHNVFSADLLARPLTRIQRYRALLNPVRLMRISKELALSRKILGKTLVSVSEGGREDVEHLAGGGDRVSVIPNGVDILGFSGALKLQVPQVVKEWAGKDVSRVILFIGHEWKRKGLDELLVSLTLLPQDYGLIVVGGASQDHRMYDSKVKGLGLSQRVLFVGEHADVRPFLAAADVFCLPSHSETMPLVALESLAAGVPIVLTAQCPASDFIVPNVTGSVTTGEPAEIAAAILRTSTLVKGPADVERIKATVARCDWSHVGVMYSDLAIQHTSSRSSSKRSIAGVVARTARALVKRP
ncbi:glycosyltransferase family 4 protein [Arthrobacter sp. UYCu723]